MNIRVTEVNAQEMVPEFSTFQNVDPTNYVDMATGDLNFSTMLLDIPSTNGSFPIKLGYSPGIKLNQQSSWVGMGFLIEPGAIYRSVSQIPDDYRRNKIRTHEYDPGEESRTDIPNFLQQKINRLGDAINTAGMSLSDKFTSQLNGQNRGVDMQALGELGLAYYDLASTVNPAGAFGGPLSAGLYALQMVITTTTYPKIGSTGISSWDYTIVDEVEKEKFLFFTTDKDSVFKWSLDKTVDQNAYGFLYEHDKIKYDVSGDRYFSLPFEDGTSPTLKSYNNPQIYDENRSYDSANITSDYFQFSAEGKRYDNTYPVFSAQDDYIVSSPMISGQIIPTRYDNVSLSSSNISNRYHGDRIATYTYALETAENTQRPQFIFKQDQSNYFNFFHESVNNDVGGLQYKVKALADAPDTDPPLSSLNPTIQSLSLTGQEESREGYNGQGILKKGINTQWFTNEDISTGLARENGLIDYKPEMSREFDQSGENANESQFPEYGIGAFIITDKNGMRYHFSLPVYERSMISKLERYSDVSETTYSSTTTFDYPFAKKWLLTSITGPDFVDDGSKEGYIDNFDHGYYVKFEYGKYSSDSYWRTPEKGEMYSSSDLEIKSFTHGIDQQYFLNAISTNTHTAMFLKEKRLDYLVENVSGQNGNLLSLKEIILLNNTDYAKFLELKDFKFDLVSNLNDSFSTNVLKYTDVYSDSDALKHIEESSIRKIKLNHDYSIQPQAPNIANGKLTLKSIEFLGRNDVKKIKNMSFEYGFNPIYNQYSWDGWGMYKDNQEPGLDRHSVADSLSGRAWSLSKINTPNNNSIDIQYVRDSYTTVGTNEPNPSKVYGGNLKVTRLEKTDNVSGITEVYKFNYKNGIATREPSFASTSASNDYLGIHKYPVPFVMYGEVSKSQFSPINESKKLFTEVTKFSTIDSSTYKIDTLISRETIISPDYQADQFPAYQYGQKLNEAVYNVEYRDNTMRLPLVVKLYDANDTLLNETRYSYEDSPLGVISQAAHLFDHSYRNYTETPDEGSSIDHRMTYRYINTVSTYFPTRLKSITNIDKTSGLTSNKYFSNHNFYTGEPLNSVSKDAYGNIFLAKKELAFEKPSYAGMGLLLDSGKNQLTHPASNYVYKLSSETDLDSLGDFDSLKENLVSASTQTWDKTDNSVWRPKESFVWKGKANLNNDGTYPIDDFKSKSFNWSDDSHPEEWEKQTEILSYGSNGIPLIYTDINGNLTSNLEDPSSERVIATVANASPAEIAFSGAEYYDRYPTSEGQVSKGEGTPSTARSHTGDFSLLLSSGSSEGFIFELDGSKADLNKRYIASVWVYLPGDAETESEMEYVELFYSVDGMEKSSVYPILNKNKSKSWYRLVLEIEPETSADNIRIGCRNNAIRSVYFDDFRVQPLESTMKSYVYDKRTDQITYVLNNDNFYISLDYDELGNLITTKKEFFYTVDKVISRNRINYSNE